MATVRLNKSGNYEIRVSLGIDNVTKKRRWAQKTVAGTTGKRSLERAVSEFEASVTGGAAGTSTMTVDAYMASYLDGLVDAGHSPTSVASYRSYAKCLVHPWIGSIEVRRLSAADIDSLYRTLLRRGGRSGRGISGNTCLKLHNMMHKAFKRAVTIGVSLVNPFDAVERPRASYVEAVAITLPDLSRLLQAIGEDEDRRRRAAVLLALDTGMRRGEVCALRWCDVDLANRRLRVAHSLAQIKKDGGDALILKLPKSKTSDRTIQLPDRAVATLKAWRDEQDAALATCDPPRRRTRATPVISLDGEWSAPSYVSESFSRLMRHLEMPGYHFHSLRHTHATHLLAQGISIKEVAARLGHYSASVTLSIYAHAMPDDDRRAADAMEAVMDNAEGGGRDE